MNKEIDDSYCFLGRDNPCGYSCWIGNNKCRCDYPSECAYKIPTKNTPPPYLKEGKK